MEVWCTQCNRHCGGITRHWKCIISIRFSSQPIRLNNCERYNTSYLYSAGWMLLWECNMSEIEAAYIRLGRLYVRARRWSIEFQNFTRNNMCVCVLPNQNQNQTKMVSPQLEPPYSATHRCRNILRPIVGSKSENFANSQSEWII